MCKHCSPTCQSTSATSIPRRVIGTSPRSQSSSAPPSTASKPMPTRKEHIMSSPVLDPHVQAFFAEYRAQQRRLSPQTILSCRDTFRLWLTFLRDHTRVEPPALRIADVDAPVVLRFLDYLEQERGNSVRSRNIRLAALRSFFRFVALRDPESLDIVTRVLAIPVKRTD